MRPLRNSLWRAPAATALGLALAATLAYSSIAPAATGTSPGASARTRSAQVEAEDFAFHPGTLRIRRGAKVVFANRDGTAHTATGRGSFDTGRIRPGHSKAVRFDRRGTFRYVCTIHPFMHGKIVVR